MASAGDLAPESSPLWPARPFPPAVYEPRSVVRGPEFAHPRTGRTPPHPPGASGANSRATWGRALFGLWVRSVAGGRGAWLKSVSDSLSSVGSCFEKRFTQICLHR